MDQNVIISPKPAARLGKFAASRRIAQESWTLLKQDKEIMWFPVLSMVVNLIVGAIFGAILFFAILGGNIEALDTIEQQGIALPGYALLFVYYLLTFFAVNFFQAGLFVIVHARMNGQNMTFGDGVHGASKHASRIFVWSVISATIGVVLQAIANRSKIVGNIVAMVLGAAWNILTYFSLPALVIGETTVIGSFKESAATIRKTWGEAIIINIGVGLFFGLLIILGFAVWVAAIIFFSELWLNIGLGVLLVFYVLVLTIISSALGAIFKLALYEYAHTGVVPRGFSPELIQGAITKDEKKGWFS